MERAASYRRGLEAALRDAGLVVTDADEADVVIVPLREPGDCARIDDYAPKALVVALLPDAEPRSYSHALRHGARGAVPWDDDPETIAAAVAAALSGEVRIPAPVAAAIAAWGPDPHGEGALIGDVEVEWLLELAKGGTVVRLAERYGYSERAMFRKLADLYARLGVTGRAEALVAADRLGLLEGR
jgi:DNA-binding NarL/FixJ family response regulator